MAPVPHYGSVSGVPRPVGSARVGATGAPQEHGGNRRELRERFGLDRILDFSASINPLGHPEGLREWVEEHWDDVLHYPDPEAAELTYALSDAYGLAPGTLLPGNGSAELFDLAFRALDPSRVVLCPPDFGLYERLAPRSIVRHQVPRDAAQGFEPAIEALRDSVRPGDLVIFSNPGNPAGCLCPRGALLALLHRCQEIGATLAVDEAFGDFCPEESLLSDVPRESRLLVFRSLTKFYGIPGLRLGFLAAQADALARVAALQVPWSVNALAQTAGVHCAARGDWGLRTLDFVGKARDSLREALGRLPGFRLYPSRANYLLVELSPPAPTATELYEGLARIGILVRHCGSFGLGDRHIRVAVRTPEDNQALVDALSSTAGFPSGSLSPRTSDPGNSPPPCPSRPSTF